MLLFVGVAEPALVVQRTGWPFWVGLWGPAFRLVPLLRLRVLIFLIRYSIRLGCLSRRLLVSRLSSVGSILAVAWIRCFWGGSGLRRRPCIRLACEFGPCRRVNL